MTRLERIRFIEENSQSYKNTDWSKYDDDDVFRVYHCIPLTADKEEERDREAGWLLYWWGKIADKLPDVTKQDASWNFPACIITLIWLVLFNPICIFLYMFGLGACLIAHYYH